MDEPDDSFNAARHELLEALAQHEGWTLLDAVRAYNHIAEFKRRIDIGAMNMTAPASYAIH